jgi:hypothetical protein
MTASYGLRWLEGESTQDGNAKADILGRLGERAISSRCGPSRSARTGGEPQKAALGGMRRTRQHRTDSGGADACGGRNR